MLTALMEVIENTRPTALPAVLFLPWLVLFLIVPARYTALFFAVGGALMVLLIGGPWLGLGLIAAIVCGYGIVEGVMSVPDHARSRARGIALLLLHVALVAAFQLPLPQAYRDAPADASDMAGVFVFFSGIGLTFFRLTSYLWDRTRGECPRLGLSGYLSTMLYFPQFRHGPIERAGPFSEQLRTARERWTARDLLYGVARIAFGYATLGALLALGGEVHQLLDLGDRSELGALVRDPSQLTDVQFLVLVHVPIVMLYLLESAFASIALGVSRCFGVHGSENYRFGILSKNPRDVWHRWNITTFRWMRDYAYRPFRGHRLRPLVVAGVFIYCGLIHGVQWRFFVWGAFTGVTFALYVAASQALRRRRGSGADTRPAWVRLAIDLTVRVLTLEWCTLSVIVFSDAEHFGLGVFSRYLELFARPLDLLSGS